MTHDFSRRHLFKAATAIPGATLLTLPAQAEPKLDWDSDKLSPAVVRAALKDASLVAHGYQNRDVKLVTAQARFAARSATTFFDHTREIGLNAHVEKNLASYLGRPSDLALAKAAEQFNASEVPLSTVDLARITRVPTQVDRDKLTALAHKLGWESMVNLSLQAIQKPDNLEHAVYNLRRSVPLFAVQNPGIQDAGNLTLAIGAIVAGIGALAAFAGFAAIAASLMIAGAVVAAAGAIVWIIGGTSWFDAQQPAWEVQY